MPPGGDSYLSPPWAQVLGFSVDFSLFHSPSSGSTGLEEVCHRIKEKKTDEETAYVCPSAQGQAGLGWPLRGSGDRGDEAAVLGKKGQEGGG